MLSRTFLVSLAAASMIVGATPASAKNDKTPPGDPCAKANGNPCNGNNGNDGDNGNSGGHGHGKDLDFTIPGLPGRGAFVTQIGDANEATVNQTNPNSLGIVLQHGDRNVASLTQRGSGRDFAKIAQAGDRNEATVTQSGAGENVLYLGQLGHGNEANAVQASQGESNGAVMYQLGAHNEMNLTQNGADNQAILGQIGYGNEMTATQNNDGNRLVWTQVGNDLSNLNITQPGGHSMMITQTGWGN